MARSAISFFPMTGRRRCAEMNWCLTWGSMDIGMEDREPKGVDQSGKLQRKRLGDTRGDLRALIVVVRSRRRGCG